MRKIFISQPMRDRTENQIQEHRNKALEIVQDYLGEQLELIDSFFADHIPNNPLASLGRSIIKMGEADLVVFAEGGDSVRGCRCERMIAEAYGLNTLTILEDGICVFD